VSFYGPQYGLRGDEYVIGGCHRGDPRAYLRELDRFRGHQRVWVLISHALPHLQELPMIISYLDHIGVQRDSLAIPARIWYELPGTANVHAYLYDLSDKARLGSLSVDTFPIRGIPRVGPRNALEAVS
jgi:hypothetical protein